MRATRLGTLPLSSVALAKSTDAHPTVLAGSFDNCVYAYSVDYGRVLGKVGLPLPALGPVFFWLTITPLFSAPVSSRSPESGEGLAESNADMLLRQPNESRGRLEKPGNERAL